MVDNINEMPRKSLHVIIFRKPFLGCGDTKRKKRPGARILRDILSIAGDGEKKTHIMFGSNINPTMLEKYLKLALEHGLLVKTEKGYATTPKGKEFIKNYDLFQSLLEKFDEMEKQINEILSGRGGNESGLGVPREVMPRQK